MRVRRVAGQALVEFALVAPLMFVLIAVVFEFGWTYYQLTQLNNLARVTARQLASQNAADNDLARRIMVNFGGAVSSATRTIVVSSPVVSGNVMGPGWTTPASQNLDRSAGNVLSVYLEVPYWSFTRICDLRRFGGPATLRAKYTYVID